MSITIGDIGGDFSGNVASGDINISSNESLDDFMSYIDFATAPEEVLEVVGEMESLYEAEESPTEETVQRWTDVIADCIPHLVSAVPTVVSYLIGMAL